MATIEHCFFSLAIQNSGNDNNANLDFITEYKDKSISCSCSETVSAVGRSVVKKYLIQFCSWISSGK